MSAAAPEELLVETELSEVAARARSAAAPELLVETELSEVAA
jgi:hypothetical protein